MKNSEFYILLKNECHSAKQTHYLKMHTGHSFPFYLNKP